VIGRGLGAVARLFGGWHRRFIPHYIERDNRTGTGRSNCLGERSRSCIVEALRAVGIEVETCCEQGVCGTCLTTVLAGRPAHHDVILTEVEQKAGDRMVLCVSRSLDAELVLDL
jgi:ferredoxin